MAPSRTGARAAVSADCQTDARGIPHERRRQERLGAQQHGSSARQELACLVARELPALNSLDWPAPDYRPASRHELRRGILAAGSGGDLARICGDLARV